MCACASTFGPWAAGIDISERIARLRAIRALVHVLAHNQVELRAALAAAEDGDDGMLAVALVLFERVPTLRRRNILASYCALDRDRTNSVKQSSDVNGRHTHDEHLFQR